MEAWQVTLLAAFVGGAVALAGTLIAQRGESGRDRTEDQRRLRDAKRERERKALSRVLMVARAIRRAMYATQAGPAEETPEQRSQRIFGPLRDAFAGIEQAEADLLLEADAKPMLDEFQKVETAWTRFQIALGHNYTDMEDAAQKTISEGVDAIEITARARLAELEKPI